MNWFLAGWVLVLQTVFWGLGLTLLILPGRWRRFWPAWVGPVGLTLQSTVVWAGAHTTLAGTDVYALVSCLLPLGLLAAVFRRPGTRQTVASLSAVRRWWVLVPILSASLAIQDAPFLRHPGTLTAVSLGSCDAADYAAGARVLKEFSSKSRSGFLGQPEQLFGLSVDNFYEFWLRLNHFTPSAVLALDASLLRRQPYELTSLLGVVLVLLQLPAVFWLARSLFRFRPAAAAVVTLIYGCNPVVLYAVGQVALGQLLAAPAVALILWTGWQADRAARRPEMPRRLWAYFGLLLAGNSLLMGSYNFFMVFAYVPLVAFVGGRVLVQRRGWQAAGRLAGFIAVNLVVCAVIFPERFIGLGERFMIFHTTPFGWRIAVLRPDGWYGALGDALLQPAPAWAIALGVLCLLALGAAAWAWVRRGHGRTVGWAAACVLPILCGYGILNWEEWSGARKNASYDAYKLFAVFYPVLLPGLCLWLAAGWRRTAPRGVQAVTAGLATVVLLVNLAGAGRYVIALRNSVLAVGPGLSGLAALEHNPDVASVNVLLPTGWDGLWANQFLLHKAQYLVYPTYEGRYTHAPLARWDLTMRDFTPSGPSSWQAPLAVNPEFAVTDRLGAEFLEVRFASGWYAPEQNRGNHWYWSGPAAVVVVTNPHSEPVEATLQLTVNAVDNQRVRLFQGTTPLWENRPGGTTPTDPPVHLRLSPGETTLRFQADGSPANLPSDARKLHFALYGFALKEVPGVEKAAKP